MVAAPRECPCFSGARYALCCGPLHRGDHEAATCAQLMRSRFAAFALGLGGYLVRTLAADHPDLSIPHDALARELGRVRERQRFLGLRILDEITRGEDGDVVFLARIFERGADRSFAEVSTFRRESGGWRYASGLLVPRSGLPTDLAAVTHDDVRAAARGGGASSDCR